MRTEDDATDLALLARFTDPSLADTHRQAAFHDLVRRHQRRVYAVCLQVLRSQADAEDATQETFVRLARGAETFRGDAKLSTWLYRVARNVCTDLVRHDARRPATPVEDVARLREAPTAADEHEARETAIALEHALAQLDPDVRELLLLVAVEGLSYADAAAAVDLPVGTVKSRVSRARVRLGELLAEVPPAAVEAEHHDARPATAPDRRDRPARGPPA